MPSIAQPAVAGNQTTSIQHHPSLSARVEGRFA